MVDDTARAGVQQRRVLVVERISTLRQAYTRILATAGYDAVPAGDPVDARTLLGFGAPDVAVVEVDGSVPGGVALIAELRIRRIPVLAVAPPGEPERAARRAGAGGFPSRPGRTCSCPRSGCCSAGPAARSRCTSAAGRATRSTRRGCTRSAVRGPGPGR